MLKIPIYTARLRAIARRLSCAIALNTVLIAPAIANCSENIARLDYFEPAMARLWEQLQSQTEYPWGTARPYGALQGSRIVLTADFDRLDGSEKDQVINLLRISPGPQSLASLLTPEERERPRGGVPTPYAVYSHDGRLLHASYDGCTLMRTLTERDRYIWGYARLPYDPQTNRLASPDILRNAGPPTGQFLNRNVQYPISSDAELALRLSFWNAVGYDKANQKWWIAWVPEQGHFEINVAEDYNPADLEKFWQVASRQYRYVVLTSEGTPVLERF